MNWLAEFLKLTGKIFKLNFLNWLAVLVDVFSFNKLALVVKIVN